MTQEFTPHESPQQPSEPAFGRGAVPVDGADLASVLSEAYDAPPVPASLVRKLNDGIEAQWGHSPTLVQPRRKPAAVRAGSGWLRSWPIALAVAAMLMLLFVFGGGSKSYAWSAVVEAITGNGLISMGHGDAMRWLDLPNRVIGQRSQGKTQWIDLRRRVVWTRDAESSSIRQEPLGGTAGDGGTDHLLAVFLSRQPLSAESLDRLRGLKVVDQSWRRRQQDGRDYVDLNVRFEAESRHRFSLTLQLDPDSKLPLEVAGGDAAAGLPVALAYRDSASPQLRSLQPPTELPIVNTTPAGGTPAGLAETSIETVDSDDRLSVPSSQDPAAAQGQPDAPNPPALAASGRDVGTDDGGPSEAAEALPIGAANRWSPVTVVPRTDAEVLQRIDSVLEQLWQQRQLRPVAPASDLDLLRRAYLDLAGRTPTVTEVRQFLGDTSNGRYERLVDQLIASPDHASQLAAVWRSFLIPEGVDLDAFGGRAAFEQWLAERFASDEPYDQTVRKLLLAEGRLSQSGPLLFYTALKLDADQLAARTSRAFLGMRLECAQCHDHPFEPWTQEDFWSYAAFFAQISRPRGELETVSSVMRVRDVQRGDVMIPETEIVVAPRFLGDPSQQPQSPLSEEVSARRQQLADWLTGARNPYFARATVNRLWALMFGRGIVDPVDDFGVENPPVSPELLDTLASQLIDSGFDLSSVIRSIALSKAYRLGSSSPETDEAIVAPRLETFAQMNVKTLTAEQLYDCIAVATMLDQTPTSASESVLARFGNSQREEFLQRFAAPTHNRAEYLAGIPQALMLMNGSLITGATGETSSGLLRSLEAPFFSDRQRIDVLFMATLSRPASRDELELVSDFLPAGASPDERSAGLADLLWALINSSEFTLNH